ncbi:uncharacterized protein N7511_004198 [Penicillium nucicola]|uniref:uncharacterized protein n=1 Tax=Penicillium nucicola TaxID=1850975 RepID=UPI002544DB8B|nr:uncharacterized protein N7511_004198 [Penicillium nucicola]KAJ5766582.1 hypothetical protein N7511_004198 [Penicillium nucicola]
MEEKKKKKKKKKKEMAERQPGCRPEAASASPQLNFKLKVAFLCRFKSETPQGIDGPGYVSVLSAVFWDLPGAKAGGLRMRTNLGSERLVRNQRAGLRAPSQGGGSNDRKATHGRGKIVRIAT